jgi:hypothetical protein
MPRRPRKINRKAPFPAEAPAWKSKRLHAHPVSLPLNPGFLPGNVAEALTFEPGAASGLKAGILRRKGKFDEKNLSAQPD